MQVFLLLVATAVGVSARPRHSDPYIDAMLAAQHQRVRRSITHVNETTRCFGHEIGCFTWEEVKFSGHYPEDPGQGRLNVTFNLYTREDVVDRPTVILYENKLSYNNLPALKKKKRPLIIVTHGFGGSGRTYWVVNMKNAILKAMDANVLAVDWRRGSSLPLYNQAIANSMSVGRATARLLAEIKRIYKLPSKKIHYLGFSMGAQVGGFAGRHYYKLTGEKFGRMTLLDPAAPGYEPYGVHANKEDSDFTVVVHTSAGDSLITGRVGMIKPIGHIDFYPNGGVDQPGCRFYEVQCHHERAHLYMLEAVKNSQDKQACVFKGHTCEEDWSAVAKNKCTTKSVEGEMSFTSTGEGRLYVRTREAAPFCVPVVHDKNESLANFKWM